MSYTPLQQTVIKLIKPLFDDYVHPQKGVIKRYDNQLHFADIDIDNPHGAGLLELKQVPIQLTPGIHMPGPFAGDEVWVTFTGGKLNLPKITSFADRQYGVRTREHNLQHKRQGAYVPNSLSKEPKGAK